MPFITKKIISTQSQTALSFLMNDIGLSRSDAQRCIHRNRFSQNANVINDPQALVLGEYEFICFEPVSHGLKPSFVADDFIVYDKPHGLSVHPQSRKSPYTLTHEIKHEFGNGANVTHRIDYETSGLVLVSLNKKSDTVIKKLFAERMISKHYLAMVKGEIKSDFDIIEPLHHIDHPNLLISMVVKVDPILGKFSHTHIQPLQYFPELDCTFIKATPFTGRTHQIRAHLFHVKHPIIGDPVYGPEEENVVRYIKKEVSREERYEKYASSRLLLHAQSLEFEYKNEHFKIESKRDFLTECFESMKISALSERYGKL